MQTDTPNFDWLAEPVSADHPCGQNLDGSALLAELDALRIFGLLTPPHTEPDWRALRDRALSALRDSRDLRLLAHFIAATLRTGSLIDALPLFEVSRTWLARYWNEVYPRLDGDAIERRNALNCLSDRVAVIDGLRRLPLIAHSQLGTFSLRDIDIATGVQPNPDPDREPRAKQEVAAALESADSSSVIQLRECTRKAQDALRETQEIMRQHCGDAGVPQFDSLSGQLSRIQQLLTVRIDDSAPAAGAAASPPSDAAPSQVVAGGSVVRSRQDAVRALDAVADYFRRNEPSSPVPLIVERAKRMVSMDFLAVLADLAPEGLEQARRATGVRQAE